MKRFTVVLTEGAAADLEEIADFLRQREGEQRAEQISERLEGLVAALERFPLRGRVPPELSRLGVAEFLQVTSSPWRIFYRVEGRDVHVLLVADGRRDMQALLLRRLLRRD